jgi:hypothetical protein
MTFPYKENLEVSMKQFYQSLCERDKRRYAAIESEKLPCGINYIPDILGCDPKSIGRGEAELNGSGLDTTRIRKMGGERR